MESFIIENPIFLRVEGRRFYFMSGEAEFDFEVSEEDFDQVYHALVESGTKLDYIKWDGVRISGGIKVNLN